MKNTKILTSLTLTALALALVFSPGYASAKNKDKDHDKRGNGKDKTCLRAFGRLVAPGLNSNSTVGVNCWLPFGISKKFRGGESQNQNDTVAPVLSNININPSLNSAVVNFDTNERANATVFYGTAAGVNIANASTVRVSDKDFEKSHRVRIPNLASNTKYYVVIQSKDKSGNIVTSSELSFTTDNPVVAGDSVSPVIRSVIAFSTNSSVTVGWVTNEPSTTKVFYSTAAGLNLSSAASVESSELRSNHFITIPNLSANTKYYLVIQSKDAAGNVSSSSEFSATTGN